MPIDLSVPRQNAASLQASLDNGQCLFVLGANGTGKSSLMHAFYKSIMRLPGAYRHTHRPGSLPVH